MTPTLPRRKHRFKIVLAFAAGIALLAGLALLSLAVGSRMFPLADAFQGLIQHDSSTESIIVWKLRLPRTLAAILVGVSLSLAGILMQSLTRNPLAEPGVLGVNSGAAVLVVSGIAVFGMTTPLGQLWLALLGSGSAAAAVFFVGMVSGGSALDKTSRLLLSGVALNACLSAITGIITMFNSKAFDSYRFWVVGSLEGRDLSVLFSALPFTLVGLLLALALIRPLGALALGEDAAAGLGVPVPVIRAAALGAIMFLCGSATAVAGPISFVGLVVPHVLRLLVGVRLSYLMPLALVYGPVLMLAADVIGRVIAIPSEVEVGIVTAFIGAPILLLLVLRLNSVGGKRKLKDQAAGLEATDSPKKNTDAYAPVGGQR